MNLPPPTADDTGGAPTNGGCSATQETVWVGEAALDFPPGPMVSLNHSLLLNQPGEITLPWFIDTTVAETKQPWTIP